MSIDLSSSTVLSVFRMISRGVVRIFSEVRTIVQIALHVWTLGDRTQSSDSEKKFNLPLCLRPPKTSQKEIYGCVRTVCTENRPGSAKFVVFHLLIGLIAVAVTVAFVVAPRIY